MRSSKKTAGIVSVVIGIALIILSYYVSGNVERRVSSANREAEFLTNNPISREGGAASEVAGGVVRSEVRSAANRRAAPYERAVFWGYLLGGFLVVLGGGLLVYSMKK